LSMKGGAGTVTCLSIALLVLLISFTMEMGQKSGFLLTSETRPHTLCIGALTILDALIVSVGSAYTVEKTAGPANSTSDIENTVIIVVVTNNLVVEAVVVDFIVFSFFISCNFDILKTFFLVVLTMPDHWDVTLFPEENYNTKVVSGYVSLPYKQGHDRSIGLAPIIAISMTFQILLRI
jgi:hypothetical protein